MPAPHPQHLYLHGFASGPTSTKAVEIARALSRHGIDVDVPDLNLPSFEHLTLSAMVEEAERRLRPRTVVWGSSLGGYLAALLASRHPDMVARIVIMAPALDFPELYPVRVAQGRDAWARGETILVHHHAAGRELPLAGDMLLDCTRWPSRPAVTCPALVFAASRDDIVPLRSIRSWAELQPCASLHVIDDTHDLSASVNIILARACKFLGLSPTPKSPAEIR
jgi:uncharacterized protein